MAYIAREDGEHFVIPSYRDVIAKRNQLKATILDLSEKYGNYICFQRRGLSQVEVAFSRDPGYLFGECVWHHFKRPANLIYCETIADTTEAYFVIVKEGAVYLDGTFTFDSIAEELLVFTTQKNIFDIYIYGNVPISKQPQEDKFSLNPALVKSFNELNKPLFQDLPVVKHYQLQVVDVVLRREGIGVFPAKYVLALIVVLGMGWMGYSFVTMHKRKLPSLQPVSSLFSNPYMDYNRALASPSPEVEVERVIDCIHYFTDLPGWAATDFSYNEGNLVVNVKSLGGDRTIFLRWAEQKKMAVKLLPTGFSLTIPFTTLPNRGVPPKIYSLDRVVINLQDAVDAILPGNSVQVASYQDKKAFKQTNITIAFAAISPEVMMILAEQLKGLPLVLSNMSFKIDNGLTGTINLQALGN